MTLTHQDDGTTLIQGPVVDQAALHGLLQQVRDTGLPLVSVTQAEPEQPNPTVQPSLATQHQRRRVMTTTDHTPATKRSQRVPMDYVRRTALLVGVLFVITYITSIAAKFALYPPLLDNADYIVGDGEDTRVLWGAFAEVILIIANIGTAVALYPDPQAALPGPGPRLRDRTGHGERLHRRRHPQRPHGRDHATGLRAGDAENAALVTIGHAFVTLQEWTFNLGPGFVVGVGNGLLLGYMMYRTGLVPRGMAMLGLVGGSLVCLSGSRRHPRSHRGRLRRADARLHAGVLLGAQLRRVPDREGLQARTHHRRDGGRTMRVGEGCPRGVWGEWRHGRRREVPVAVVPAVLAGRG